MRQTKVDKINEKIKKWDNEDILFIKKNNLEWFLKYYEPGIVMKCISIIVSICALAFSFYEHIFKEEDWMVLFIVIFVIIIIFIFLIEIISIVYSFKGKKKYLTLKLIEKYEEEKNNCK